MNENLAKKQVSLAHRYSYTRLALNYYMYCDAVSDFGDHSPQIVALNRKMNELIGLFLEKKAEEADVAALRNQMKRQMEFVTMYADCFEVYENVLNRMEGRFADEAPFVESEELFVSRIMKYITGNRDRMVMNERIKEMVAELPVRLTKSKFGALVQEGLSAYIGSDKSSLDTIFYLLRTSSMMNMPEELKTEYENLHEMLEKLKNTDWKTLTKEEYHNLTGILQIAVEYMEAESSALLLMQDIINDLYVLILTQREAILDKEENDVSVHIISTINRELLSDSEDKAGILDDLYDSMEQLEGKQESLYERYLRVDSGWTEGLSEDWKILENKLNLLLSESAFADLDETAEEGEADKEYVMNRAAEFVKELNAHLFTLPRPVSRAVMAKVLSSLPVFFNSVDEIEQYVKGSLESCTDIYEKGTCMELIRSIMEMEENALV